MRLIRQSRTLRSSLASVNPGARRRCAIAAASIVIALLSGACTLSNTGVGGYQANLNTGCRITATATVCPGGRVAQ